MISPKKLILPTFSALGLITVAKSDRTLSLEKDEKELVRSLTSINKLAIKSFQNQVHCFAFRQTEHGDILDCIDINKQLAFDHPLLKNHTIQFAVAEYRHQVFGAKVNFSIWEPEVSPTQFSSASMLIAQGSTEQFQSIRAGWIVYQWLNQNHSRLYTYWTADGFIKTGCYNILCPGFVQVSARIPFGILFGPVSVYDGPQYEVGIRIYKDGNTGDWWLVVYDENVGYWPNSLFTKAGLGHGASLVAYGGEVYSPVKEKSPSMGSAHFPSEGYLKAAYVTNFEVVEGSVATKPLFPVTLFSSTPNFWYNAIFFGGPGKCV
uniref:Neprosin PEP catalytic domain-containing protein n=2 Tax=Brassica oleracea var. oleracea TaxID=109376 RepID=A0A0D3A5J0_BRAOL